MRKPFIFSFLLLFVLFFTACLSGSSKWEYKVMYYDAQKISSSEKNYVKTNDEFDRTVSSTSILPSDESLNNLGKDGWELVSSYVENETVYPNLLARGSGVAGLQPNVRPQRLVVIFKRPAGSGKK